jgi:hypothetical protein
MHDAWQMCLRAGFVVDRHLSTANVAAASFGNATFFPADGQMYPQVPPSSTSPTQPSTLLPVSLPNRENPNWGAV